ncbi:ComEC/Rec2 family competence protein [Flagellimonas beolgyonensis]|uniref:ComEC/Rec2 family competence protein n=1 Tax=Flagellimonas beolgyonensis TaxID=864064 RepID=UPI003D6531B6
MSVKLTLCVMAGIVIGFYLGVPPLLPLIFIPILLLVLFGSIKRQPRNGLPYFELSTSAISIGVGMLVVGMATSESYSKEETENIYLLKVREVLKPNSFSQSYMTTILAVDHVSTSGKLLLQLSLDSTFTDLKVDDEVVVFAKPLPIAPPLNPHQFDYRAYLKKLGVTHQIKTSPKKLLIKNHPKRTVLGVAHNFREHIISKLKQQSFGPEELGVMQALLLGQRDDISETTYTNYQNAGAVHILAVSGLHVGILLLLLEFLLSPLERMRKGKTLKLLLVVALLWMYAFIAGLSPSIVRAVTMFSFLAYALYLNRPTNPFNIIALSMLFILLIKPLFLFQVGFQMSYAAVIAIVWIYPKLQRFWYPEHFLVRKIWQLLSVSVAAQLGVLPISLFYFHQFPALFFVSNLLVIPFLGVILGTGILVISLALFDVLPLFLVKAYNKVIHTMNSVIGWVAQQEGFLIRDIPFDATQLVLGYMIFITLVRSLSKPTLKRMMVPLVGIILFQGWVIWKNVETHHKEQLVLTHKTRNSVLLHQTGSTLNVFTSDSTNLGNLAIAYAVAERIQNINLLPLKNSYQLGEKRLFVVDSLGLFPLEKQTDYVLLTHSPKINLERLLDSIQPKMVLADGSNFKSFIARWEKTCAQKEIPFHYTGEKGYYVFNVENN